MENKKIVVLSHTDLDGYGCSYLMDMIIGKDVEREFINVDYGEVEGIISYLISIKDEISYLYISDLNLSLKLCEMVDAHFKSKVSLLDHHITGKESADKYKDWYILDSSKSATKAVYDKWLAGNENNEISFFVDCVNAADIFNKTDMFKFNIGRNAAYYLNMFIKLLKDNTYIKQNMYSYYIINFLKELNNFSNNFKENNKFSFNIAASRAIFKTLSPDSVLDLKESQFEYINAATLRLALLAASGDYIISNVEDETVFIYRTPGIAISDVADMLFFNNEYSSLLNLDKSPTIMCAIQDYVVSLRSKSFDISRVAKDFGGGGHKLAAGFTNTNNTTENELLDCISKYVAIDKQNQ